MHGFTHHSRAGASIAASATVDTRALRDINPFACHGCSRIWLWPTVAQISYRVPEITVISSSSIDVLRLMVYLFTILQRRPSSSSLESAICVEVSYEVILVRGAGRIVAGCSSSRFTMRVLQQVESKLLEVWQRAMSQSRAFTPSTSRLAPLPEKTNYKRLPYVWSIGSEMARLKIGEVTRW